MSYDPNRFKRHNNFMDSLLHIGTNQTGGHKCSFVCLRPGYFLHLNREHI